MRRMEGAEHYVMTMSMTPGTMLGNRYRLEDLLEEIDGAQFWRATDTVLARSVAIHVIHEADPRSGPMLEAARLSATVTDQRVLRVLDADQRNGVCWVINEWGNGQSLDVMLSGDRTLRPDRIAWLVREAASATAAGHRVGVAHGRLVPENVILTESGTVRLIGYAIDAVLRRNPRTGNYPHATAEQADVLDLTGLLYAGLVARWPGASVSQVRPAPRGGHRPLRPRQVRAGVPGDLDLICDRVLGRRSTSRTATQLAAVLSEFLGELAGVAETETSPVRDAAPREREFGSGSAPEPAPDPDETMLSLPPGAPGVVAPPDPVARTPQQGPDPARTTSDPSPGSRSVPTSQPPSEPPSQAPPEPRSEPPSEAPPGLPSGLPSEGSTGDPGDAPDLLDEDVPWDADDDTRAATPAFAEAVEALGPDTAAALAGSTGPDTPQRPGSVGGGAAAGSPASSPAGSPTAAHRSAGIDETRLAGPLEADNEDSGESAWHQPHPEPQPPPPELEPVRAKPLFAPEGTTRRPKPGHAAAQPPAWHDAITRAVPPPPDFSDPADPAPLDLAPVTMPPPGSDPDRDIENQFAPVSNDVRDRGPSDLTDSTGPIWPFGDTVETDPDDWEQRNRTTRHWLRLPLIMAVVAALAVAAAFWFAVHSSSPDTRPAEDSTDSGPSTTRSGPLKVQRAADFDPFGDGEENADKVAATIDGNRDTAWQTLTYRGRPTLGGLKPGVGVLLDLGSIQQVGSARLQLTGSPYDVALYVAPTDSDAPVGMDGMREVAQVRGAGDQVTLTPRSAQRSRYLVVWLTSLPAADGGYRGAINEITVRS